MDNLELVKAMRKPAMEIMKEKRILASFTIACALDKLNSIPEEDAATLFRANNVMAKVFIKSSYNSDFVFLESTQNRGKRFKVYDSIKDAIIDWLMGFKSYNIYNVYDISTICSRLSNKEYNLTALKPYIDAYQLDKIDEIVFEEIFPSGQTVVEVPISETFVRKFQQLSGYNGTLPYPQEVVKETILKEEETVRVLSYTSGEKAITYGANLYKSYTDKIPYRAYTGNVWLYDGKLMNDRYAVVLKKDSIGKDKSFIDGYIKKSELQ